MKQPQKDLINQVTVIRIGEIKRTKAYNKLAKLQKLFVDKKHTVQKIHHGYNVSRNIGLDAWLNQSNERHYIVEIVKELVEERV